MNDEDTSHVNDQKSGLGVEGNESSSSLSATGAVSASSMDRNHRIFLHLVPFKIAIPQVNRISPQPPQQQPQPQPTLHTVVTTIKIQIHYFKFN